MFLKVQLRIKNDPGASGLQLLNEIRLDNYIQFIAIAQ